MNRRSVFVIESTFTVFLNYSKFVYLFRLEEMYSFFIVAVVHTIIVGLGIAG